LTAENNHILLIKESLAGSVRAQKKLYDLYAQNMFNLCLRMLNKREEAEEMLQDAFSDAFLKLHSFRGESTFGAWLKQIVINKCINQLKRKSPELTFAAQLPDTADASADEGIDSIDAAEMAVRIKQAVSNLPDGSRTVFTLYMFEGYDHEEISQILGVSESTSKTQYMRARQLIREQLTRKI
jgi:RNA polymerase sigma factor (sigma-70 family)